jgi:hypothetical protein
MDNTGGSDAEIFSHCGCRSAFPVGAGRCVAGAGHTDRGNTGYWSGCYSCSYSYSCARTGSGARRNTAGDYGTGGHSDCARDLCSHDGGTCGHHHDRASDGNQEKEVGQDDPAAGDR